MGGGRWGGCDAAFSKDNELVIAGAVPAFGFCSHIFANSSTLIFFTTFFVFVFKFSLFIKIAPPAVGSFFIDDSNVADWFGNFVGLTGAGGKIV